MTSTLKDGAAVPMDGPAVESAGVKRTLNTWQIIVLIVAAMTPLSIVAGTLPLGLGFGGPSTAAAFAVSGVIIGIFCVGYAQMIRRINRPGAFYNYISRGLGKPAGVATGMLAAVGYPITIITAATVQAVVLHEILLTWGLDIDWRVILIVSVVLVMIAAWREIDLNAKVLSVVVVVEVAAILVLVAAIVLNNGLGTLTPTVFSLETFRIGDWQVAFIFAMLCYQAYEAGAMYAPEAKRPEKTVPRALYGALFLITGSLVLISWALTGLTGAEQQMQTVADHGFTGYIFVAVEENLGAVGLHAFSVAVMVAQMACLVGFVNFASRYLNGLAKDGILPSVLAKQNRHNAPGAAVLLLGTAAIVIPLFLTALGVDAYTQLSSAGFALGAIAATAIQIIASVSVVAFFIKEGRDNVSLWKVRVAPIVATVLLLAAFVIEIKGFSNITGTTVGWTTHIPWALPVLWLLGLGLALYWKFKRPHIYDGIAAGDSAEEAEELRLARMTAES